MNKDLTAITQDWSDAQRNSWISLYQDRVATLKELYDLVVQAYFLPVTYDWENLRKLIAKDAVIILQLLQQELSTLEFEKTKLLQMIKAFCKTHDYKMAEITALLRFALIGSLSGPSVMDMLVLLGPVEVSKRIQVVLAEL